MSEGANNQTDHTELNSQVSHYFQQIKQYASDGSFGEGVDLNLSDLENESVNQVVGDVYTDQNHSQNDDYSELVNVNVDLNDSKELRPNLKSNDSNIDKESFNTSPNREKEITRHLINSIKNASNPISIKHGSTRSSSVRQCPFCSKTFQHAGSLGRHLDNQKGNDLHPLDEINKIRSNVARRGNPAEVKARRLLRAREYNSRDYVKEKNRIRRQLVSKFQKVRNNSLMKFYRKVNIPTVPTVPSFAFLVLTFLPADLWPHDPPTAETYRMLISWIQTNEEVKEKLTFLIDNYDSKNQKQYLNNDDLVGEEQEIEKWTEKIRISFEDWQSRSQETKKDIWVREQRTVAQQLLGKLTYFDFAVRDNYAKHLMMQKKSDVIKIEAEKTEYDKLDDAELAAVAAAAAAAVKGYDDSHNSGEE